MSRSNGQRWIVWRIDLGNAHGQWQAHEPPTESVLGGRVERVEVMPVSEHDYIVSGLTREIDFQKREVLKWQKIANEAAQR